MAKMAKKLQKPPPLRGFVIAVVLCIIAAKLVGRQAVETRDATSRATETAATASPPPPRAQVTFSCPDGRRGVHVVHTRFLVGQASATPLFVASRLQLMRTFLVPSLNAQSTKRFVYYASYDPDLTPAASRGFEDAVSSVQAAHVIALKERAPAGGDWANLNFGAVADKLAKIDPEVRNIELYITSRVDSDDAAHAGIVEAFQQHACNVTSPGDEFTLNGGSKGKKKPKKQAQVKVAYPQGGLLWFPAPEEPYGAAGAWRTDDAVDDLYRVMSIFPTMILAGKEFVGRCAGKINVYAMRHYQPEDLETLNPSDSKCAFKFSARKDILYWDPPAGDASYLYVRTPSSWTRDKEDLKYNPIPLNVTTFERSFGVGPAALAATNLLFSGFASEAPELLAGKGSTDIER